MGIGMLNNLNFKIGGLTICMYSLECEKIIAFKVCEVESECTYFNQKQRCYSKTLLINSLLLFPVGVLLQYF